MPMPSIASAPGRSMPGWLKGGLLAALMLAACWGGAIWYWQTAGKMPATGDLVLYLLALPLALLAALWLGPKAFARSSAGPAAAASGKPIQEKATLPLAPPLAILAASLRTPHGASVAQLRAALDGNKARPDLDRELVDDDGFPVTTARSSDAIDEALHEEILEWLARHGMAQLRFSEEQWRALTLASAVTGELASGAATDIIPAEGAPPMLQLVPLLPAEWHDEQRRAVGIWLKHMVAQFGWPAARITLATEAQADTPDATPAAVLGRLAQEAVASDVPVAALLVACASYIGEETVAQWSASGTLFTSLQPQGLVPGEGAAALLVTDLRQARAAEGAAFALLDMGGEARRDSSADEARRTDSRVIGEVADRTLKHAAAERSDVAMIIADTGHRSNRGLELMGFAAAAMPQLDGETDVVRVGVATGTCGAVPFVTALALAHHHVLEHGGPVLCVSNEDPYRRGVVLVRPEAKIS
jgi:hypothetical protein